MTSKHFEIENLSLYRNQIYGFSTLWIMLFHGKIMEKVHLEQISPMLDGMLGMGNVGVDIFLFLSGISCFFSYHKENSYDNFIAKRLWRIFPSYLLFGSICWFIIDILLGEGNFFYDLTLYSFWKSGQELFWYVALIPILYLLYPFVYQSLFSTSKPNYYAFYLWMISILLLNAYLKQFNMETYENIEIALCRIPVFLCGCLAGYFVYHKKNFYKSFYVLCILISASSYYICRSKYLPILGFRYTYLILGIVFSITLSIIFSILHNQLLHSFFGFFGNISLELYIVHIGMRRFFMKSQYYVENCFKEYLLMLILCVLIALPLRFISLKCMNLFYVSKKDGKY